MHNINTLKIRCAFLVMAQLATVSPLLANPCCFVGEVTAHCTELEPFSCEKLGGVPQTNNLACGETQGCCLGTELCVDADPVCCDELGGTSGSGSISMRYGADGLNIITNGIQQPLMSYFGVQDTFISTASPEVNFRLSDLEWVRNGLNNDTRWGLIKFSNILDTIPPNHLPAQISVIQGHLDLFILNGGADATIHELFVDFKAASVTFNNFLGGQEPQAGVHYNEEVIATVVANFVGETRQIRLEEGMLLRLVNNDLPNNELRFIIVPAAAGEDDADDNVRVASSEFGNTQRRPLLFLIYLTDVPGGVPLGAGTKCPSPLLCQDADGDGVGNKLDKCNNTPLEIPVDTTGRPIGDLDLDCDVDVADFALMQLSFTGPLP